MNKVQLTESQIKRFEKLWFIYGNSGKKCTKANHSTIQGFIEAGENRIQFYKDGYINVLNKMGKEYADKWALTDECIAACEEILNNP